jgi:hypothetical protein
VDSDLRLAGGFWVDGGMKGLGVLKIREERSGKMGSERFTL